MEKKNVTFDDIAKYTNFSKTTISRYFNNPDSLTLKNQEIIADALIALDYKENKVARILASGKTEFVGIIIPNISMHYYPEMLNHILSTYETFGYKFLVFIGNEDIDSERRYIQELLSYKIEGMVVLSHTIPSEELEQYGIPIVAIEREDKFVSSVNSDNYLGAVQATSLLIKNDCDILIHINSDISPDVPAYGRISGFLDICSEHQIEHQLILTELGAGFDEISTGIARLLDDIEKKYPNQRKGIFMPNDTYANIFLNALVRRFGQLPDSYRIVGFDNSPISREAIVPISTVGQQINVIASEAMTILSGQMEERKKRRPKPLKEPIHKKVTPVLLRRGTTD